MTRLIIVNSDSSLQSLLGDVRAAYLLHRFLRVSVKTGKDRSLDQNALMWSLLSQIAKQVVWYGQKLTKENWKDVLTASLNKQTVVPGLDGGFVVCGTSTSSMTIKEMSEVCELAIAFGTQQGVEFREFPAMEEA